MHFFCSVSVLWRGNFGSTGKHENVSFLLSQEKNEEVNKTRETRKRVSAQFAYWFQKISEGELQATVRAGDLLEKSIWPARTKTWTQSRSWEKWRQHLATQPPHLQSLCTNINDFFKWRSRRLCPHLIKPDIIQIFSNCFYLSKSFSLSAFL